MMLYTIVPIEFVMSDKFKPQPLTEVLAIKNGVIETRPTSQGKKVTALFSTNPKDYLNPQYSLGQIID